MSQVKALGFDLTEGRHDPKETVLPIIRDTFPWHWDPMKMDHNDGDCYIENWNDKFDWEGLSRWAAGPANFYLPCIYTLNYIKHYEQSRHKI